MCRSFIYFPAVSYRPYGGMQDTYEEPGPLAAEDDGVMSRVGHSRTAPSPTRTMPSMPIRVTYPTRPLQPTAQNHPVELRKSQEDLPEEEDDSGNNGSKRNGQLNREDRDWDWDWDGQDRDDNGNEDNPEGARFSPLQTERMQTQSRHLPKAAANARKQEKASVLLVLGNVLC